MGQLQFDAVSIRSDNFDAFGSTGMGFFNRLCQRLALRKKAEDGGGKVLHLDPVMKFWLVGEGASPTGSCSCVGSNAVVNHVVAVREGSQLLKKKESCEY